MVTGLVASPSVLVDDWRSAIRLSGVSLWWLGQAGFLLRAGQLKLAIDPYLSDSLAKKYTGKGHLHERMMPPPIDPGMLDDLNYVLCTHRHGDHMDAETLTSIRDANPHCRFIVPAAEHSRALEIGLPEQCLISIDADERIVLGDAASVAAIPAAHEELTRNAAGQHHFLGYMLSLAGAVIYHSGDCIPYAGLDQGVQAHAPDLALLPINGRGKGVAGNFTLDEAIRLSETAGIASVIAHHFGMFTFNTVDPVWARTEIAAMKPRAQVMLAETGVRYSFG